MNDRYRLEWSVSDPDDDIKEYTLIRRDMLLNETIILIERFTIKELTLPINRYASNLNREYNNDYNRYVALVNEYLKNGSI